MRTVFLSCVLFLGLVMCPAQVSAQQRTTNKRQVSGSGSAVPTSNDPDLRVLVMRGGQLLEITYPDAEAKAKGVGGKTRILRDANSPSERMSSAQVAQQQHPPKVGNDRGLPISWESVATFLRNLDAEFTFQTIPDVLMTAESSDSSLSVFLNGPSNDCQKATLGFLISGLDDERERTLRFTKVFLVLQKRNSSAACNGSSW